MVLKIKGLKWRSQADPLLVNFLNIHDVDQSIVRPPRAQTCVGFPVQQGFVSYVLFSPRKLECQVNCPHITYLTLFFNIWADKMTWGISCTWIRVAVILWRAHGVM